MKAYEFFLKLWFVVLMLHNNKFSYFIIIFISHHCYNYILPQHFIAGQKTDITEFDEALVKKLIEKIIVFADHFTVEFKSGLTIEIEA